VFPAITVSLTDVVSTIVTYPGWVGWVIWGAVHPGGICT
jgi:hypothetical protein